MDYEQLKTAGLTDEQAEQLAQLPVDFIMDAAARLALYFDGAPSRKYPRQTDQDILEARSLASGLVTTEPSLTLQGPAHDADVNTIAKAHGLVGRRLPIPDAVFDPANFMDDADVPRDLQAALELVREADRQFFALPSDLRSVFLNSPAVLWNWVRDPANASEAVRLGFLSDPTPIVDPSPLAPPNAGIPA